MHTKTVFSPVPYSFTFQQYACKHWCKNPMKLQHRQFIKINDNIFIFYGIPPAKNRLGVDVRCSVECSPSLKLTPFLHVCVYSHYESEPHRIFVSCVALFIRDINACGTRVFVLLNELFTTTTTTTTATTTMTCTRIIFLCVHDVHKKQ